MPNHVTHRCTVTGPAAIVQQFREECFIVDRGMTGSIYDKPDTPSLDFQRIIPMPAALDGIEAGSDSRWGYEAVTGKPFPDLYGMRDDMRARDMETAGCKTFREYQEYVQREHPEQWALGLRVVQAIKETGYPTWYEWSIAKWGTKWNSYSNEILTEEPGRLEFRFDTAWSPPVPVFEALTARYPALVFELVCFDEGWGFAGQGRFFAGLNEFETEEATNELYYQVYGAYPESEEE